MLDTETSPEMYFYLRVYCGLRCGVSRCWSGAHRRDVYQPSCGCHAECCAANVTAFCLSASGEQRGDIISGQWDSQSFQAAANTPLLSRLSLTLCLRLYPCSTDQNFLTSSCENSLSKKLKDIFMKYSWLCPSIATAKHIAGLRSGLNLFEKIEILLAWLNSVLIPPLFGCMHYCFLSTIFVLCTQLANAGNRNEQQKKAVRVKINILSSWRLYFMFVKIMEY